jgi:hypothetical protein
MGYMSAKRLVFQAARKAAATAPGTFTGVATGAGVPVVVSLAVVLVPDLGAVDGPVVVAAALLVIRPTAREKLVHAAKETATPPDDRNRPSTRRRLRSKRGSSLTLSPSPLSSRI